MPDPPKLVCQIHLIVMLWNKNVHTPLQLKFLFCCEGLTLRLRQVMPDIFIVSVWKTDFNYLNSKSVYAVVRFIQIVLQQFNQFWILDIPYFTGAVSHKKPLCKLYYCKGKSYSHKRSSLIKEKVIVKLRKKYCRLYFYIVIVHLVFVTVMIDIPHCSKGCEILIFCKDPID